MKREAEAQRMRDGGMSYAAIGQIHGVSGETIRRWLNPAVRNRHNIANVLYRSAHKEEKRASAVAYYAAHKEKIAAYRVEHRKEFSIPCDLPCKTQERNKCGSCCLS